MNLLLSYLFMKNRKDKKNQKGVGEVKVEIPMVLEEYPNPENILNVITATRFAPRKSARFGKRNIMM